MTASKERLHVHNSQKADYCYSVWLRHLMMAHYKGLNTHPKVVAELGPGDSLGVGLSALLTGSQRYYALDFKRFVDTENNLVLFDRLVELFMRREAIPDEKCFPNIKPPLVNYEHPRQILTESRLNRAMTPERITSIRKELINLDRSTKEFSLSYNVPWHHPDIYKKIRPGTVDMVLSQAVMEHVENLSLSYKLLFKLLKPGGFMSHQIDLKSHGTAKEWNWHWTYSKSEWNQIRQRYAYPINRHPHSLHISLMKKAGFRIVHDQHFIRESILKKEQLATDYQNIKDEDLLISGAFIQAVKPK